MPFMFPEEKVQAVSDFRVWSRRGRRLAGGTLERALLADLRGQLEAVGVRRLEVELAEAQVLRERVGGGAELRGDTRRQLRDDDRRVDVATREHHVLLGQRLTLERDEEMQVVLDDRPTFGDSELPARGGCLRQRRGVLRGGACAQILV